MFRVEVYPDASGQWRWRGVDGNNRVICDGAEGYLARANVERAVDNVMTEFRAEVRVITRDRRRKASRAEDPSVGDDFVELASYDAEGTKS